MFKLINGRATLVKRPYIYSDEYFNTFYTNYGKITLYKNEHFIGNEFKKGRYWDIDTLMKLKSYIDPDKNILEIGGHCGTSSIIYASFLNSNNKITIYEPQRNMFNLLNRNILQNNLQSKCTTYNSGVFCYDGKGNMNNIDLDDSKCDVSKRYIEEHNLDCNFGGISLGKDGEEISMVTIDGMNLENLGFIHCDAQGSEPFIFSRSLNTISKFRPIILYENIELYNKTLYYNVCKSYPEYKEESMFDIKKYCMENLNYSSFIDGFNGNIDTLLLP